VARFLIIGCGCRGRTLARELRQGGHAVRGTTRDGGLVAAIEAVGAEAYVGDPDRVATLTPALEHVSAAVILLGSATGPPASLAALHGTRLEMLLTRMLDTTVRGIVYEAAGSVDHAVLLDGAARVRAACEDSLIPYQLLDADPRDDEQWLEAALGAADRVLGG
jgi:Trk K+ transport system NAD-binding subunit